MQHNIKSGHALIDHRDGISVEVGNHISSDSFKTTLSVCKNIKSDREYNIDTIDFFKVVGVLEESSKSYVNFRQTIDGFYPVLAGEKAYSIPGLKAIKEDL